MVQDLLGIIPKMLHMPSRYIQKVYLKFKKIVKFNEN